MVKLCGVRIECTVDVSQTAFLTDVGENHATKLVPTLEMLAAEISLEFVDNALELVSRQQLEELGDNEGVARHWTRLPNLNGLSLCCPGKTRLSRDETYQAASGFGKLKI